MAKRIFSVLFVSFLSVGYLSVGVSPKVDRRLASCTDAVEEANLLPLPSGLFGQIKDEALRKSTLDFYIFLSNVEMQALAGRQSMRGMYGLSDMVSPAMPITSFNPGANAFATGSLWGKIPSAEQNSSAFTVGNGISSNGTSPAAGPGNFALNRPAGMAFTPNNQATQSLTQSPLTGVFFPTVNAPNHKIGTF